MASSDDARPGYADDKQLLRRRLRRVEGQVRGIQRMVDEDRYCIDVLQQVSAAKAALDQVALRLVDDHVANCMAEGATRGERRQEMTGELMAAVARLVRS